jgi:dTDP-4-amino-4,6-dideoxygalactose transaminase
MIVRVPNRNRVLEAIRAKGVEAMVHYPTPIHLQPAFTDLGYAEGAFPAAEALAASVLSLPLFSGITNAQVDRCVAALAESLWEAR